MKIDELKVVDLKIELERRNLPTTLNRNWLKLRLREAVKQEGLDPDNYEFGITSIKPTKLDDDNSAVVETTKESFGSFDVTQLMSAMNQMMERQIAEMNSIIRKNQMQSNQMLEHHMECQMLEIKRSTQTMESIIDRKMDGMGTLIADCQKRMDETILEMSTARHGEVEEIQLKVHNVEERSEKEIKELEQIVLDEKEKVKHLEKKLQEIETIVCALMKDTAQTVINPSTEKCNIGMDTETRMERQRPKFWDRKEKIICWLCDKPGHIAKFCWNLKCNQGRLPYSWRKGIEERSDCCEMDGDINKGRRSTDFRRSNGRMKCWVCDRLGHISMDCRKLRRGRGRSPSPMKRKPIEERVLDKEEEPSSYEVVKVGRVTIKEKNSQQTSKTDYAVPGELEVVRSGDPKLEAVTSSALLGQDCVDQRIEELDEKSQFVKEQIWISSEGTKARYGERATKEFEKGQLVWLRKLHQKEGSSETLQPVWEGPYQIIKRINNVMYRIRRDRRGNPKVVNAERLELYRGELDSVRDEQT